MSVPKMVRSLVAAVSLVALSASAGEGQNWMFRVRGISVIPDESATINAIGGDVDVDNDYTLGVDLTYFFSQSWAVELMAATTRNEVIAESTALGSVDLGSIRLLPPTLTLQYHMCMTETIKPYIGAGVNFTTFYDSEVPAGGAVTDIDYDDAWGVVLQAGVDVDLGDNWVFNVDVKKVFLETDVNIDNTWGTASRRMSISITGFSASVSAIASRALR